MGQMVFSSSVFNDSKPHYVLLDGLRGVAALVVIIYHVFECFDWSPVPHGYLAVDFFFVLSGFVIGYAYDDRWQPADGQKRLTTGGFFLRRLIRLHPVVIAGAVLGVVCYLLQGSVRWDGTHVGVGLVMLVMLLNMFMLPLVPGASADVRGNGEMFPINGPHWSLFFEYIGNILYALLLRRLPTRILALLAFGLGCLLVNICLSDGYLGVGWSMVDGGLWSGMIRMLFPYTIGMLMSRLFRPMRIKYSFWVCTVIIVAVACLPLAFGNLLSSVGGAYDAVCVIILFPILVWLGASELTTDANTRQISALLGNLSYPLYAIHYPLMYLFYAHIGFDGNLVTINRLSEVWLAALVVPVASIVLAWLCFRYYDLPLRRWLTKRAGRSLNQ